MKKLLIAVMLIAATVAWTQSKTDPTLDKLASAFLDAVNMKDATKVAAFYSEDAVLMPPDAAMIKGRTNIEAYYKDELAKAVGMLKRQVIESAVNGSSAYDVGTTARTVGNSNLSLLGVGGGSSTRDAGKYSMIYRRVQNDWKIAYHIFNRDSSVAPSSK